MCRRSGTESGMMADVPVADGKCLIDILMMVAMMSHGRKRLFAPTVAQKWIRSKGG